MTESELLAAILNRFGSRPGVRLWRQNTGMARTPGGQLVRFGVPGQADISGLRIPSGQRVEIECKSARGHQTQQQRNWQAMIEKHGGLYILARSVEDVERALS